MTLRLIRCPDSDGVWYARSGEIDIGTLARQPGGSERGRWQWSIARIYEPGWNFIGSGDTRDEAMRGLGSEFRRWLAFAGLEEADRPAAAQAPFAVDGDGPRKRVLTPAGLHVGFVEPALSVPELITTPREPYWSAWLIKFTARFPGSGAAATTIEDAVAGIAAGFRAYIASAGLREK